MFLLIAAIGKLHITTIEFPFERLSPCMSVLVDLAVLGASEDLATAQDWEGEGFLIGVHTIVVEGNPRAPL